MQRYELACFCDWKEAIGSWCRGKSLKMFLTYKPLGDRIRKKIEDTNIIQHFTHHWQQIANNYLCSAERRDNFNWNDSQMNKKQTGICGRSDTGVYILNSLFHSLAFPPRSCLLLTREHQSVFECECVFLFNCLYSMKKEWVSGETRGNERTYWVCEEESGIRNSV